jgi:ATP/maltotriose-dependent transcriptional regulator MalT
MGDYVEARQHYQASHAIRAEFDDPEGMAVALNHLGQVAVLEERFDEAGQLYDQSLAIYRQLNDRGGLATALSGLGAIAWATGEYETTRLYFQEALQIATEIQFVPLLLSILLGSGELLLETNRAGPGLELLALVRHHPASERETKERAEQCLTHYQPHLPEDLFNRLVDQARPVDLDSMVALAQTELAMPLTGPGERQSSAGKATPPDMSALVEPLTERELEVLGLIAQGLTNQQIADGLVISVGTVKFYTSQIYGKLGVNSRTQAVARARELGLLA